MRKTRVVLSIVILCCCVCSFGFIPQKTNLVNQWDTVRPLVNPDKGWYHHMLDNSIGKYLIQDEKDLSNFKGMDHLYLRLAWAFLEPEEGKFDWSYIDRIVEKYVPMGYKISFRISCKETGPAPNSVPYEIEGIRYATPYWVVKAGAKGIERPQYGTPSWTPVPDDPIFLSKLDHFHKAFAERYDGKSWLRYVDIGSIGDWGEGHTYHSTRIVPTVKQVKTHIDLHLKYYKKTLLIVTDDLLSYGKTEQEQQELLNYSLEKGLSLRDDSPMVKNHVEKNHKKWTVIYPHFFEAAYKFNPIVFELEHYSKVKEQGHWIGKNGEDKIPAIGVSGADIFRNAVRTMRATYIGFHGYLYQWLTDNPDLTNELLNISGYWYFPQSISTTQFKDQKLSFEIEWINKGAAPAYSTYQLRGKLTPVDGKTQSIDFVIDNCGNKKWLPNQVCLEKYTVVLSKFPQGPYALSIKLFDPKTDRPVEIGLSEKNKKDGYFVIQTENF